MEEYWRSAQRKDLNRNARVGRLFWCGSGLASTSVSMVLGLRANFLVLGLLSAYRKVTMVPDNLLPSHHRRTPHSGLTEVSYLVKRTASENTMTTQFPTYE